MRNNKKVQEIDEFMWGMWVWELEGRYLADDEGNLMHVFSTYDNMDSVKALKNAAKSIFGVEEGKPVFLSGRRPITDEEYEEQMFRHKMGLIPDEFDIGALNDEIEYRRQTK